MQRPSILVTVLLAASLFGACSSEVSAPPTAAGLKTLMSQITSARDQGDAKKAALLTKALLPDAERVRTGLAKTAAPADVDKLVATIAPFAGGDESQLAALLAPGNPKRTEIQVHGATAEEIANGTTADAKEFPGFAVAAAKRGMLRAGTTYYEVEFVEPGKDTGMKFHMFFHDGKQWTMLGKL